MKCTFVSTNATLAIRAVVFTPFLGLEGMVLTITALVIPLFPLSTTVFGSKTRYVSKPCAEMQIEALPGVPVMRSFSMCALDWYIGECIVSKININNGIRAHTQGYQNCNISHILIFGGYVIKVRESLYIIWVNTILNHIDSRRFCLGMKVLA